MKSPIARIAGLLAGATIVAQLIGLVTERHALIPWSVLLDALVRGGVDGLFAIGIVLVYRAGRFINFAHASIAIAASIVFLTLQGDGWAWPVAAGAALAGAIAVGVALDVFLLRRFVNAPRLVLTVVTMGAGQLIVSLANLFPQWRFGIALDGNTKPEDLLLLPNDPATSPWSHIRRQLFPLTFTGDHLVAATITVAAVAGLALFFRRSNAGIAIRGAAENAEKAGMLGISTGMLSVVVWALAGGLAALSAVLALPLDGSRLTTVGIGLGTGALLRGLGAAVIGRMDDLPLTFAAALGISLVGRAVLFSTTTESYVNVALLVILGGALLGQRRTASRTDPSATEAWSAVDEVRPIPRVLAEHATVKLAKRRLLVIGAVILIGYPFAMSPSQVFLGGTFAIYGIIAISLVVLTGWGGQISLGQFALVAVGAAVGGGLLSSGWPFLVAALVAGVSGALVALALGLPALRIRGLFLAVTTLAFAVVMSTFVLDPARFSWLVPRHVPRPRFLFVDTADERAFYYLALGGLLLAVAVAQGLRRTRTGRVLIAMRDNERAAQAVGLSLVRVRLTTFAIAGFLAAFAGVLLAAHNHAVRAQAFGAERSIDIFLMAVIGGLGSVSGVLTGAVYLGLVQVFVPGAVGQLLASGAGVLVVLVFYPSGLGGAVYAARDAFLRRVALRDKIFAPSLFGDLRSVTGETSRAPLGIKPQTGARVGPQPTYALESVIADAGESQRTKGWVYG